jgi:hypothetical protein
LLHSADPSVVDRNLRDLLDSSAFLLGKGPPHRRGKYMLKKSMAVAIAGAGITLAAAGAASADACPAGSTSPFTPSTSAIGTQSGLLTFNLPIISLVSPPKC